MPLLLLAWTAMCFKADAGGSGLNVMVVVNAASSNSVAVGNYYAELRHLPPQNVLRMSNWSGGAISWSLAECRDALVEPLHQAIQLRGLTNQIDYVLLSMDIPYRVIAAGTENSTTSVLYYGFKTNSAPPDPSLPDSCSLPDASSNSLAGSELPFRDVAPGMLSWTNLMASMITAQTVEQARLALEMGVSSDSLFPTNPAVLVKTSDVFRNVRYLLFDNAVFNARVQNVRELIRTNGEGFAYNGVFSGAQAGNYYFNPSMAGTFTPGALADSLTSGSGALFDNSGHVTARDFIEAGASGSYGTVVEPCNYLEKFPSPQIYFYQSRGFNLAESYYMGLTNPYQGVVLGDPLAAPFGLKASVVWSNLPSVRVAGTIQPGLSAIAPDTSRPIASVDIYTNGTLMRTLTNIPPRAGNVLSATINGMTASYTIPTGATLNSSATGLASAINAHAQLKNVVKATAHGDRVELQWTDMDVAGADVPVDAAAAAGSAGALQTYVRAERPAFLETIAHGIREFKVTGNPTNRWLSLSVTKTNGSIVSIGVTNSESAHLTLGGLVRELVSAVNAHPELTGPDGLAAEDFVDADTAVYFNLRARAPGWKASQIKTRLTAQGGLSITPSTQVALDVNVSDLRARNHLYVTSGVMNLAAGFELDTTMLPEGWNELAAVAKEGSNVRAQTLAKMNVLVQNAGLMVSVQTTPGANTAALHWPAIPGRTYTILSSTNLAGVFEAQGSVTATNTTGRWEVQGMQEAKRFYRVREEL